VRTAAHFLSQEQAGLSAAHLFVTKNNLGRLSTFRPAASLFIYHKFPAKGTGFKGKL
jgi:hypothetical protein